MRLQEPSARSHAVGFSLPEVLVTMLIGGVLASVAYPAFTAQIAKARRLDGLLAIAAGQLAQERWRAQHARYGDAADIGLASISADGHYLVTVTSPSASGYTIRATATGSQARDADCRHLRVTLQGPTLVHASGPDAATSNAAAVNRRCWSS